MKEYLTVLQVLLRHDMDRLPGTSVSNDDAGELWVMPPDNLRNICQAGDLGCAVFEVLEQHKDDELPIYGGQLAFGPGTVRDAIMAGLEFQWRDLLGSETWPDSVWKGEFEKLQRAYYVDFMDFANWINMMIKVGCLELCNQLIKRHGIRNAWEPKLLGIWVDGELISQLLDWRERQGPEAPDSGVCVFGGAL